VTVRRQDERPSGRESCRTHQSNREKGQIKSLKGPPGTRSRDSNLHCDLPSRDSFGGGVPCENTMTKKFNDLKGRKEVAHTAKGEPQRGGRRGATGAILNM